MKRNIIEISQEKCNGCGLCIDACHEGALQLIDGKAVLISDEYCDGLGHCLPECPTDAIRIIEREAAAYDEELVLAKQRAKHEKAGQPAAQNQSESKPQMPCGCPGTRAALLKPQPVPAQPAPAQAAAPAAEYPSQLGQWPCQLNLINPNASYLQNADILIAADCTAYAYASFHEKYMKGKITLIGCPKLDDNDYYTEKLAEIFRINEPRSITVARMSVPCCTGIVRAVKEAMLKSQMIVPYNEVIITPEGQIM